MSDSDLSASVQYNDFKGTAAADEIGPEGGLDELAEDNGVDTDKYSIIGARLFIGENHPGRPGHVFVTLLAVEKELVGENTDQIQRYANDSGNLPYHEFSIQVSIEDFIMQFKRLSLVLLRKPLANTQNFALQENDEEE